MYTEVDREDVAISLYIKRLSDEDAGEYECSALYAGNLKISASVSVSVFRKFYLKNIFAEIYFPELRRIKWNRRK